MTSIHWLCYGILLARLLPDFYWATGNPVYQWGPWSSFPLTCSVTCGRGVRCRTRKCLDGYGNVQANTARCSNPEDFDSKAEMCSPCVLRSRCPRLPGWSDWTPWSRCWPKESGQVERAPNGCLIGMQVRTRKCNNPPPEPPPFRIPCTGTSRQVNECNYACDSRPAATPDSVAKQVQLQVEEDHRNGLREFRTVLRKHVGERVSMDCSTPAYRLAKRLLAEGISNAAKRAFASRKVSITWQRNGQKIHITQPESGMPKLNVRKRSKPEAVMHELQDEELRWISLLQPSSSYTEGDAIILPSIVEGDQGFYTCELRVDEYRWTTIFYSLIVIGVRYLAQSTDPFYLHSNLGFSNALSRAPVWLEAAQIIWLRNGLFQSRGLAARLSRRIQKIDHLNYTHTGTWLCFLAIPAPGPPSKVSTPFNRVAGLYLINEFHLSVRPSETSLWQLAEHPNSIRVLRNVSVTLAILCLFLVQFLLLNLWAARRWIHRSLSGEQTRAIVQELVDNACRLMLTARRRASINKDRLLPLILQEHQRLERTNRHLNERLLQMNELRMVSEKPVEVPTPLPQPTTPPPAFSVDAIAATLDQKEVEKTDRIGEKWKKGVNSEDIVFRRGLTRASGSKKLSDGLVKRNMGREKLERNPPEETKTKGVKQKHKPNLEFARDEPTVNLREPGGRGSTETEVSKPRRPAGASKSEDNRSVEPEVEVRRLSGLRVKRGR